MGPQSAACTSHAHRLLLLQTGDTALILAAKSGASTLLVEALLEKGAEVNVKDKTGRTALMWAAANGYPGIIRKLAETKKADVHLEDPVRGAR